MLPTSNIFRPKFDTLESKLLLGSTLCTTVSAVALALIFTQVIAVPILATLSIALLGACGLAGVIYFIASEIIGRRGTSLSNKDLTTQLISNFNLNPEISKYLADPEIIKKIFNHVYYTYKTKLFPEEHDYLNIKIPPSKFGDEAVVLSTIITLFAPHRSLQIYSDFLSSTTYTNKRLEERNSLPGTIERYFNKIQSGYSLNSECEWTQVQATPSIDGRQLFTSGTYTVTLQLGKRTSQFSASLDLGTLADTLIKQTAIFSLLDDIIGGKPKDINQAKTTVASLGMDAEALLVKLETFANSLERGYIKASRPFIPDLIRPLL